ncbi:LuxR C-terminal-related transcriptional regulator [Kitasatospora xanthocidica]|uniref:LuxR C-terminal-related transcriptional regulator n=1 Tax=Kitasatospora xanthocidica TaxID=83382 RepID=UPI0036E38ADA
MNDATHTAPAPDDDGTVQGEPCPNCGRRLVLPERAHLALVRVAGGNTVSETATYLGLAPSTVEVALMRARRVVGARNLAHLTVMGVRAGLVPLHVPRHLPAPLTARRLEIFTHFAEGLTINETAAALGVSPHTITTLRAAVFRQLGVATLPGAVTMLCSLGQVDRDLHCVNAACVAARRRQAPHGTPENARAAALQWADGLAEAARERVEHQRLRRLLDHVTAQLAESRADAEAMLHRVEQAGRQVAAATRIWVETAELRHQVRDLAGDVRAAATTAQEAHRLAASTHNRVEETLQTASLLAPAFEELETRRKLLAAEWRALEAARAQPQVDPEPERVLARPPVPAEERSWRRP